MHVINQNQEVRIRLGLRRRFSSADKAGVATRTFWSKLFDSCSEIPSYVYADSYDVLEIHLLCKWNDGVYLILCHVLKFIIMFQIV